MRLIKMRGQNDEGREIFRFCQFKTAFALYRFLLRIRDRSGTAVFDPFRGMVGIVHRLVAVLGMGRFHSLGGRRGSVPGTDPPDEKPDEKRCRNG